MYLSVKEVDMYTTSDNVRIVREGSPFDVAYDIRVEYLKDGEWTLYSGFNTLSDDYAYTNANEAAIRCAKTMVA
jgi:hypothetical protein